jgi:ribosomal protein L2
LRITTKFKLRISIITNMPFDWGDTVQIASDAPVEFRPGEFGAICGISNLPSGEVVYTIEFGDGTDIECSGSFIKEISQERHYGDQEIL